MADTPLKVLLIEDNPGDVRLIREALSEAGGGDFEMEHAEHLDEGLELLSRGGVDAVLLDLNLPDSEGLDTLMKVLDRAPGLPVVVLTSIDSDMVAVEAVKRGAQDYLMKGEADGNLLVRSLHYAVERKRAEEALRESEERYRLIYDHTGEAIYIYDRDFTLIGVNRKACEEVGYSEEEILGRNALELGILHPDDFEKTMRNIERVLSGEVVNEEIRFIRKDGTVVISDVTGAPLYDRDGEIIAITNIARDITERKQAEEALKQSEEYFRSLIENAYDAVSVVNVDGSMRYTSPSFEQMTGYTPEEVYGRNAFEFIHPDDAPEILKIVSEGAAMPNLTVSAEYRFQHKDGSWHYLEAVGKNLLEDPSVRGIVVNYRDITERKRADEALRAVNRELEAYAHSISHDLRGPLALIIGFARTAITAREKGMEELERDSLDEILSASWRVNDFIESLLQYARAGRPEGEIGRVEPGEALGEVLTDLEKDIHEKGIELKVEDDLPVVLVDPIKLRQVFLNLVGNAVKFAGDDPAPRVEIGAKKEGDTVTIYVRDNGLGIPEEKQEAVFEPFRRFSSAGYTGLGIGLSTVKRAVKAWGGEVWVESAPGEGSTFYFTAPAADA